MSTLLAIDTSGPSLSVALLQEGALAFELTQQNGRTHSDDLMPAAQQALLSRGLAAQDVDCFAAVTGPGSFTGVRIGVTTAKALAHATGRPCCGINALEALACGAGGFGGLICPLQDARASQVYAAAFWGGERILADEAIALEAFLGRLEAPAWKGEACLFVGDGAVRHREEIVRRMGGRAHFAPADRMMIRAGVVGQMALSMRDAWTDYPRLLPYYLRAPQAERERLAREEKRNG